MYCINCGEKVTEKSNFCHNCGESLKEQKTDNNNSNENITINNKPVVITEPKDQKGIISVMLGAVSIMFPLIPISIVGLVLASKTNDKSTGIVGLVLNTIGFIISLVTLAIAIIIIIAIIANR